MRSLETPEELATRLTGASLPVHLPFYERCGFEQELQEQQASIVHCNDCSVEFCSEACRNTAIEKYHRVLCTKGDAEHPLIQLQDAWKAIHYPPESANIMLLARIIAMIRQSLDRDESGESATLPFLQFYRCYTNSENHFIHKFLDPKFDQQLALVQSLFEAALYDERIKDLFSTHGFRSLLALVGMNGQGVGTSTLDQYCVRVEKLDLTPEERSQLDTFLDNLYEKIDEVSGDFDECEGSGLYRLQSCCKFKTSVIRSILCIRKNEFIFYLFTLYIYIFNSI